MTNSPASAQDKRLQVVGMTSSRKSILLVRVDPATFASPMRPDSEDMCSSNHIMSHTMCTLIFWTPTLSHLTQYCCFLHPPSWISEYAPNTFRATLVNCCFSAVSKPRGERITSIPRFAGYRQMKRDTQAFDLSWGGSPLLDRCRADIHCRLSARVSEKREIASHREPVVNKFHNKCLA